MNDSDATLIGRPRQPLDMNRALLHRLAALLAGGVVAGGLLWMTGAAALAAVAGACWSAGLGAALRARRLYPGMRNDDGWSDARWTGLGVGLVTLAAVLGVPPALTPALRFGLSVLVLGAGLVAYATATMAEIERHPEGPVHGTEAGVTEAGVRPRAREVDRPRERR